MSKVSPPETKSPVLSRLFPSLKRDPSVSALEAAGYRKKDAKRALATYNGDISAAEAALKKERHRTVHLRPGKYDARCAECQTLREKLQKDKVERETAAAARKRAALEKDARLGIPAGTTGRTAGAGMDSAGMTYLAAVTATGGDDCNTSAHHGYHGHGHCHDGASGGYSGGHHTSAHHDTGGWSSSHHTSHHDSGWSGGGGGYDGGGSSGGGGFDSGGGGFDSGGGSSSW